jgi:hypothetical protein
MGSTEIRLTEYANGPLCVTSQDGEKAFEAIRSALDAGNCVSICFTGVEDLTSAFLNAAIGQLYGIYDGILLKERLSVIDASPQDLLTLKRSIERSKEYFKDQERFNKAADSVLGEDDE